MKRLAIGQGRVGVGSMQGEFAEVFWTGVDTPTLEDPSVFSNDAPKLIQAYGRRLTATCLKHEWGATAVYKEAEAELFRIATAHAIPYMTVLGACARVFNQFV